MDTEKIKLTKDAEKPTEEKKLPIGEGEVEQAYQILLDYRAGSHSPLQEIFLTQGSKPGLLHCRQILYRLNHQGSLRNLRAEELMLLNCGVGEVS